MFSPYLPPLCLNVQPSAQAWADVAISFDQVSGEIGGVGAGVTLARAWLCAARIASAIGLVAPTPAGAPPLFGELVLAGSELEHAESAQATTATASTERSSSASMACLGSEDVASASATHADHGRPGTDFGVLGGDFWRRDQETEPGADTGTTDDVARCGDRAQRAKGGRVFRIGRPLRAAIGRTMGFGSRVTSHGSDSSHRADTQTSRADSERDHPPRASRRRSADYLLGLLATAAGREPAHPQGLGFALADLESDPGLLTIVVVGHQLVMAGVNRHSRACGNQATVQQ